MVADKTELEIEGTCPICGYDEPEFELSYPSEVVHAADGLIADCIVYCAWCDSTIEKSLSETPDFRVEEKTETVERTVRTKYLNVNDFFNARTDNAN